MIRTRSITCARCGRAWEVSHQCVVCPECGESPANYAFDGVTFCGLHERAMIARRIASANVVKRYCPEFGRAWQHFPNADVEPDAGDDRRTIDAHCCPVCQGIFQIWDADLPRARRGN